MNVDLLRFDELLCQDEHYWHGIYVGGEGSHTVNFSSFHLEWKPKKAVVGTKMYFRDLWLHVSSFTKQRGTRQAERSQPHKSKISESSGRSRFISVLFPLNGAVTASLNLLYFVKPIKNKTYCELY